MDLRSYLSRSRNWVALLIILPTGRNVGSYPKWEVETANERRWTRMDANFQRVPSINSSTLLMNDTNFTTVSFLEFHSRSLAVSRLTPIWVLRFGEMLFRGAGNFAGGGLGKLSAWWVNKSKESESGFRGLVACVFFAGDDAGFLDACADEHFEGGGFGGLGGACVCGSAALRFDFAVDWRGFGRPAGGGGSLVRLVFVAELSRFVRSICGFGCGLESLVVHRFARMLLAFRGAGLGLAGDHRADAFAER